MSLYELVTHQLASNISIYPYSIFSNIDCFFGAGGRGAKAPFLFLECNYENSVLTFLLSFYHILK